MAVRTQEPLAAREPLLDGAPPAPEPRSRWRRSWGWIVLAFVVGGLLGWGTTAAWWGNESQPVADAGITAGDVVAHPGSFVGDTATVTGEVNNVFVSAAGNGATAGTGVVGANGGRGGPQANGRAGSVPGNGAANAPGSRTAGTASAGRLRGAFTIATPNGSLVILGAGGRVVHLLQQHPDLSQGVLVQVTGRVRRLDSATLRHLTVHGKGNAAWYGQLRNQPAIAASRVALVPTQPAQAETLRSLSLGDVANAPTAFYGRRVTLSGDVSKRLSAHAFVLSGGGHRVLVLGTPPSGGHAGVSGIVTQPKAAALVGLDRGLGLSGVLGKAGRSSLGNYQAALVTG